MKYFKVSIIGTGNVASHLSFALESAGHTICEIYARDLEKAEALTNRLFSPEPVDSLNFEESEAEVFIIAVSDNAIEHVAKHLYVPTDAMVVHTSGSKGLDVLEEHLPNVGVLYPLQTFSHLKNVNFSEIPMLLEANSENGKKLLTDLASSLSSQVYLLDSESRRTLHLSAVFVCNFVNHLYALGKTIAESAEIPFHLLHPLMKETAEKAILHGPELSQTGPALRGDTSIINTHLQMLKHNPELFDLYKSLSESIFKNK